jgi:hypothetical protein
MYPRIPDLSPRTAEETVIGFGLRAFSYVLAYRLPGLLETADLELALHASMIAVASPGLLLSTRDQYADARRDIGRTLARRTAALPVPEPEPEPMPAPDVTGGSRVPVHPGPVPMGPGDVIRPSRPAGIAFPVQDFDAFT